VPSHILDDSLTARCQLRLAARVTHAKMALPVTGTWVFQKRFHVGRRHMETT
jgi:hypothetical protein